MVFPFYGHSQMSDSSLFMLSQAQAHLPFTTRNRFFKGGRLLSRGTKEAKASGLPETVATVVLNKSIFTVSAPGKRKKAATNHLEFWG